MPVLTSGRLGSKALVSGVYTRLFQVDANQGELSCEIRLINHDGANAASARAYHCPANYIEGSVPSDEFALFAKDSVIPAKEQLVDTGIAVGAGEQIIVFVTGGNCTAIAFGYA